MKKYLLSLLFILTGLSLFGQTSTNTRQIRFFVITTASDTTAGTANDGRMWYDFATDEYRAIRNGTTFSIGSGSGGGSPAGSNTQIQYNNSGSFGASANLTFASDALTINGIRIGNLPGITTNSGLYIGNGAGVQTTWTTSFGRNTVVGTSAGSSLIDGSINYESSYNSFFGYQAGKSATNATSLSYFGYQAGQATTTAINNSLFGASVGSGSSFNGSSNSFFGSNIATSATTASENTIMGAGSGIGLISGIRNSYFGLFAGAQTTTGNYNCAFGSESFQRIYDNNQNSGYGFYTGVYVKGSNNTFLGAYAGGATLGLPPAGTGYNMNGNTFLGVNTGVTNTSANSSVTGTNYSTFVGYESGGGSTTQVEYSTALGYRAKVYSSRSMVFGSEIDGDRVNYGFGGESYGSGVGVAYFKNAVTNPTSAPSNGFLIYSNGGIGTIRNAGETASPIMKNVATTTGDLISFTSTAETRIAAGTSGYVLTSNGAGTLPTWQASASGFANPMTTEGDLILGGPGGAATRLGIGSNTYVLTSNGTTASWQPAGSGFWATTGTSTFAGNVTIDEGTTGGSPYTLKFQAANLATTQTDGRGIWITNTTAAAAGAQQISPSIVLEGQGWKTNATAGSQSVKWKMDVLPVQGAANPSATLQFGHSINGAAYTNALTVSSDGSGTGLIYSGSLVQLSATAPVLSYTGSGAGILRFGGSQGTIQYNLTSVGPVSTGAIALRNLNANLTMTSGTMSEIGLGSGFAPTSGTAAYNMVVASQTINQTGGANGDVKMFNITPTYTAAGDDVDGYYYAPTVTSVTGYHMGLNVISGGLNLASKLAPSQITADQNNYNPSGLNQNFVIRLTSDASRSITGLVPDADLAGQIIVIANVGSNNIVLVDESASSTAANRFALSGNVTLTPDQSIQLIYDATSSRWRSTTSQGGSGITNAAAANELMKSDGTNAIASGLFSTTDGNILLGASGGSGTSRTITTQGSGSNIDMTITTKGTASAAIEAANGLTVRDLTGVYAISLTPGSASSDPIITALRGQNRLFTIKGQDGENGSVVDGFDMAYTAGSAYSVSGNGNGGDIAITVGQRRTAGSGVDGNLTIETRDGTGTLKLNDGANEQMGVSTLVAGTVTVNNTKVTANSRIFVNHRTTGGTIGILTYTISAGTSFTITSSSGSDTSTVNWLIIEPN